MTFKTGNPWDTKAQHKLIPTLFVSSKYAKNKRISKKKLTAEQEELKKKNIADEKKLKTEEFHKSQSK